MWLHTPTPTAWATVHTVERHGGRVEGVVIVEVEVPRCWLRRIHKRLWYATKDVPPDRIRRVMAAGPFPRVEPAGKLNS